MITKKFIRIVDAEKKRIDWIDVAKGLTILLVIVGHTVYFKGLVRGVIFSFHMPLFFILSCATFKCSTDAASFMKKTERAFRHLMLPAILMFCICSFIWNIHCQTPLDFNHLKDFLRKEIFAGIFSSGISVQVFEAKIPSMGVPWFLVVLFVGRSFYDYVNLKCTKKWVVFWCLALSVIGFFFGRFQWFPLSFDIVLFIMPLFFIGTHFDKLKIVENPFKILAVSLFVWATTFTLTLAISGTYLEIAVRRYTLYPLCLVTAVAGTVAVSCFSVLICKINRIKKILCYIGKDSLYVLCVHMLDEPLLKSLWTVSEYSGINAICRVALDVLIFVIFMSVLNSVKKRTM